MLTLGAILVIAAAVWAVFRRYDARLVLFIAALMLGVLARDPAAIVRVFLQTLSNEQFVLPICCAVGFGYMLRHTQCDQHLVHVLAAPLRWAPWLMLPGTVLVGFLVNIPVISQVGTAVVIGPVLIPLLERAGVSATTRVAALLLGASLGGDLLNPGAPEWRTVSNALGKREGYQDFDFRLCTQMAAPYMLLQVAIATILFWILSITIERKRPSDLPHVAENTKNQEMQPFKVHWLKALVPLVPLAILFLTGPPLSLLRVPPEWLVSSTERTFESRLIGAAMLIGTATAAFVCWKSAGLTARVFFEGAGFGLTHIVSIIVAAQCFGEGIKLIGLGKIMAELVSHFPNLLFPIAGVLPLLFAFVSGTGFGTTQSLYEFFVDPALNLGVDPIKIGALVAITASAGRTLSPVAAITLHCSSLAGLPPLQLVKRVAIPLLTASAVTVLIARFFSL